MKKILSLLTLPLLLAGCQNATEQNNTAPSNQNVLVTAQDLQHHNWELVQINGESVVTLEHMQPPTLEIGEHMSANGNAGCNNFFGEGELKEDQFRIKQMGMTMKMCPEEAMDTEMVFSSILSDWSEIRQVNDTLVLTTDSHTLVLKQSDWK